MRSKSKNDFFDGNVKLNDTFLFTFFTAFHDVKKRKRKKISCYDKTVIMLNVICNSVCMSMFLMPEHNIITRKQGASFQMHPAKMIISN